MITRTLDRQTVVIVTQELDPHAEAVMDHLSSWGVSCVRLHPASLLQDWAVAVDVDDLANSSIGVRSSARQAVFGAVRSVYYRKPEAPAVGRATGEASLDRFLTEEANGARDAVYQLLGSRWFNDPYVARRYAHKLYQLHVAKAVGLLTPRTLLTNLPDRATEFVRQEPKQRAVIKPLAGVSAVVDGRWRRCFCRKVTLAELDAVRDTISAAPLILQQYIPKRRDIRVTMISDTLVACAIYSQDVPGATDDWRTVDVDRLRHEIITLPSQLVDQLRHLHAHFRVPFGAIDLVEDPDGRYWFLEDNLNGQWLWIEHVTGYPLAKMMAGALAGSAASAGDSVP
jgi:glutathione synthase/RimK-type ligase-like ATP-grasp enzyme